jgi:hypothetical protein
MRRSTITPAASMCLSVLLLTVAFIGTTAASAASRPGSVLPTGFRAQSQSWISSMHGWILGVAPCGQSTCTTVVGTTDGGGTWNTVGTLNAPLTLEKTSGVTEVRFADALHGWALDPGFWATSDGGITWTKQTPPGGGRLVRALAGDADAVYAVVSPCKLNHLCKHPPTLWRTTVSSGTWTQVPLTLPKRSAAVSAVLKVHGVLAYLVVPVESSHPDILEATTDGQTWSSRPDPCVKSNDEFLVDVAPSSSTNVALLCVTNGPQPGQATKRVLRSTDSGQTTTPAGSTPINGTSAQLAAAPNGTLVVSCYSGASYIYRNAGAQSWTTSVSLGDGGQGWNDIVFTTNKVGFVVHGPAAMNQFEPGELWGTIDGGLTWAPV